MFFQEKYNFVNNMFKTNLNLYNKSFRYVFLIQLNVDIKI